MSDNTGYEHPDWLIQALNGNQDAFGILVETYQKPVYNLCYRMLGNPGEAEEAAQETFWKAYQYRHRYDRNRSFITWLLSIAAHYCIDQQRKRRITEDPLDDILEEIMPDLSPGPESIAVAQNNQEYMQKVLNQLKPDDRAMIIFRYWHEMSEEEIAGAMSTSVSAVKSRLYRARLKIAQLFPDPEKLSAAGGDKKYEPSAI